MLIGLEDKEKIKIILVNYMKNNNISAYKLDKEKIISSKTLKKIIENPNSTILLSTVLNLREKLSFETKDKRIIDKILKKYANSSKKYKKVKVEYLPKEFIDFLRETLEKIAEDTKNIIENEIYVPSKLIKKGSFEDKYLSKRQINSFNSDFENRTLLITKIWEFNDVILEKWKEVSLLLGINNSKDNKKIKKGLLTIANNLKEITVKLEDAAFDSDEISDSEVIVIKGEK